MLWTHPYAMAVIYAPRQLFEELVRAYLGNARPYLMQVRFFVRDEFCFREGQEYVLAECAGELDDKLRIRVRSLLPACHCGLVKAGAVCHFFGGHSLCYSKDVLIPSA